MPNKMRGGVGTKSLGSPINKNSGTAGVYGRGGGPGFDNYKQDSGPDTIVTKTRETSLGTAKDQVNQMRRATSTDQGGRAKEATTTTMKTSKNTYRRAVSTKTK